MICKCGADILPKQAKCRQCGKVYSHKFWYPEQYRHPLCGKLVKVLHKGKAVARGAVARVVPSRYGQLAHLDTSGDTAYLIPDLIRVQINRLSPKACQRWIDRLESTIPHDELPDYYDELISQRDR